MPGAHHFSRIGGDMFMKQRWICLNHFSWFVDVANIAVICRVVMLWLKLNSKVFKLFENTSKAPQLEGSNGLPVQGAAELQDDFFVALFVLCWYHELYCWVVVSKYFYFTPAWGNDPIWRAYFSNGLEPPPSYVYLIDIQTTRLAGLQVEQVWCRILVTFVAQQGLAISMYWSVHTNLYIWLGTDSLRHSKNLWCFNIATLWKNLSFSKDFLDQTEVH